MTSKKPDRRPANFVYKYLANSTNSTDVNLGATTDSPKTFEYEVPSTNTGLLLMRINMMIVYGGIGWGEFGGLGSALTNGLLLRVVDSDAAVVTDFTGGYPITVNEDFTLLAGVDAIATPAAGDDALPIRFTISKANEGDAMYLPAGHKVQAVVQDDLGGLTYFRIMIQGIFLDEPVYSWGV